MPQSLSAHYLHIVFSTKQRYPFFNNDDDCKELCTYLASIVKELGSTPIQIGGYQDHIHALINLHKTQNLSDTVKEMKRASSIWVKLKGGLFEKFAWQSGYGAFSVSQSNLDSVICYIQRQKQHHQSLSFKDELRVLLDKHKLRYDEQYLWD